MKKYDEKRHSDFNEPSIDADTGQAPKEVSPAPKVTGRAALLLPFIAAFAAVNEHYGSFSVRKDQRDAAVRLLERTDDPDELIRVVREVLPRTNVMPYFPTITSPTQLEEKYASLKAAMVRHKVELGKKKIVTI